MDSLYCSWNPFLGPLEAFSSTASCLFKCTDTTVASLGVNRKQSNRLPAELLKSRLRLFLGLAAAAIIEIPVFSLEMVTDYCHIRREVIAALSTCSHISAVILKSPK